MFDKKVNEAKENAVKKWAPVLEHLKFKKEDVPHVCWYAELHALAEATTRETLSRFPEMKIDTVDAPPFTENLLPISLKVLEGIEDLSKVHFTSQPVFMIMRNGDYVPGTAKAYQISIDVGQDCILEFSQMHGIDILNELEGAIVHEMSARINDLIEEGNEIWMYLAVAGVRIISETTQPRARLSLISRYHVEPQTVTIEDL